MSIPAAYLGVIIIWSTTPLAILWSSQEAGFLFGVTSRMVIGLVLALVLAALLGHGLVWRRDAVRAYLISGLGIFTAMSCVYWSAQYVPSGWLSVIYGLTPMVTALMSRWWLDAAPINGGRMIGMVLGITGLGLMFGSSLQLRPEAVFGIIGVLCSVAAHAASSVWIKRIGVDIPAIVQTSGGLLVAVPLFLLYWLLSSDALPQEMSSQGVSAILYLALFGSTLGFTLYYYVLRHVEATRVSLITLVTPVFALAMGHQLNNEPLGMDVIIGSMLILCGLATFEFNGKLMQLRQRLFTGVK